MDGLQAVCFKYVQGLACPLSLLFDVCMSISIFPNRNSIIICILELGDSSDLKLFTHLYCLSDYGGLH